MRTVLEQARISDSVMTHGNKMGVLSLTITGAFTIDPEMPPAIMLSAASGQNVTLPAVASSKGLEFYVTASGAAALTVKNVGAVTIGVVDPGSTGTFLCDGATWYFSGSGSGVVGTAGGFRIARGATALDGSNPTTVATGLSTIVSAVACLKGNTAPGDNTSVITVDFTGSTGSLDLYGWKNTGGTDPTLVASTGTETVEWIAIGT